MSSELKNSDVVIVLESSEQNQSLLRLTVEKLGFSVLSGNNGLAGLEFIARCEKDGLPLVAILSDVVMSKMDGFTLLRHVKALKNGISEIPFFLLASDSDSQKVLEAKRLGAAGYILKPLTLEKIKTKFQEIFPNRKFPSYKSVS